MKKHILFCLVTLLGGFTLAAADVGASVDKWGPCSEKLCIDETKEREEELARFADLQSRFLYLFTKFKKASPCMHGLLLRAELMNALEDWVNGSPSAGKSSIDYYQEGNTIHLLAAQQMSKYPFIEYFQRPKRFREMSPEMRKSSEILSDVQCLVKQDTETNEAAVTDRAAVLYAQLVKRAEHARLMIDLNREHVDNLCCVVS